MANMAEVVTVDEDTRVDLQLQSYLLHSNQLEDWDCVKDMLWDVEYKWCAVSTTNNIHL